MAGQVLPGVVNHLLKDNYFANRVAQLQANAFLLSKRTLALYGLFFVITGVSLTSIAYGAQSAPYYAVLAIGLLACMPLLLRRSDEQRKVFFFILLLMSLPLFLFFIQVYVFSFRGEFEASIMASLAMSYVFFIVGVGVLLRPEEFQKLMMLTAGAHVLIGVYGIIQWDFEDARYAYSRFAALDLHIAVWAEIALGMVIAAILSGKRNILAVSLVVAAILIYGTQMRSAGIAIVTAIGVLLVLGVKGRARIILIATTVVMTVIGIGLYWSDVRDVASALLLLDNPHRGLDTGFSGRFGNWADGFAMFMLSPIVGVGPIDPVAGYTHNGIIRLMAQYGVLFGFFLLVLYLVSLKRALRLRDPLLLAALIGYLAYIMTAPRVVNLQVMPLVALFAVAYALNGKILHNSQPPKQA